MKNTNKQEPVIWSHRWRLWIIINCKKMRLNFESKAKFQAAHFGKLAEKLMQTDGASKNIAFYLEQIIDGLSKAWDKAEEQEKAEKF